jgi:hypothetical protein
LSHDIRKPRFSAEISEGQFMAGRTQTYAIRLAVERGVVAGLSTFGACEGLVRRGAFDRARRAGGDGRYPACPPRAAVHGQPGHRCPATVKPRVITLAAGVFGATQMTLRLRGYDEENDRLLFTTELDGARHLVSYNAETGIVWYVLIDSDDEAPTSRVSRTGGSSSIAATTAAAA